jgi:putative nucleotidyltransferase with HDIG domain
MAVEPSVTPVLVRIPAVAPLRARAFAAIVVGIGLAAACSVAAWLTVAGMPGAGTGAAAVVVLLALLALSETFQLNVYGEGQTSPGSVPVLAAGAIAGPLAIPLMEAIVTFAGDVARRNVRLATFFNVAVYTLSGVAGAACLAAIDAYSPHGAITLLAGSLAGLVYFVLNAGLFAVAAKVHEGRPFREFTDAALLWQAPHFLGYGVLAAALILAHEALGVVGILVFSMPALAMLLATGQYLKRTEKMVEELKVANGSLERLLAENRGLLAAISRQHLATIRGLALAIDAKDPYTAGHTERVALYAAGIADALGLSDEQRRHLEHGALLHDIGKIGVSDATLRKPGPLDDAEWSEMRRHPEIACTILEGIDLPSAVYSVIRHHHENLDGTGYPDRLVATELTIEARIARVADAFDAMTSTRPYRRALTVSAARAELRRHAGTQFCPIVVAALERQLERRALDHALEAARDLEFIEEAKTA